MTEQEELEAVMKELVERMNGAEWYEREIALVAREILALRRQLATKGELIQSQRALIEDVCKREAEAQKRVAELERGAECAECAEPAKYCTSCARRE